MEPSRAPVTLPSRMQHGHATYFQAGKGFHGLIIIREWEYSQLPDAEKLLYPIGYHLSTPTMQTKEESWALIDP